MTVSSQAATAARGSSTVAPPPDISMLDTITSYNPGLNVRVANHQLIPVVATGTVTVSVIARRVTITAGVRRVSKVRVPMKLSNVYVVP